MYSSQLGADSLPREWYRLPAHVHLDVWATGIQTWPTSEQHTLLKLYRQALAADGQYRIGHVYQGTQRPCFYVSNCRAHFHGLWSRAAVSFLNITVWKDEFLLFNSSDCSGSSLVLNSSRYATWTDRGPNPLKPSRLVSLLPDGASSPSSSPPPSSPPQHNMFEAFWCLP